MKQIKAILESLKDLDTPAVDKLYNTMVKGFHWYEFDKAHPSVMFIFPDGRMLGEEPPEDDEDYDRVSYHDDIYSAIDLDDERINAYRHPMTNANLGKFYNIMFVVSIDRNKVSIYYPGTAEPTPEQLKRIEEFKREFKVTVRKVKPSKLSGLDDANETH